MTYAKPKASGPPPRVPARRWSVERLLLPSPDLGGRWAILILVALVVAVMAAWLGHDNWNAMDGGYGDTDDATRLAAVRALLGGQGWYDQHVARFQPPVGVWMHWSRLLDGGIAALDLLFRSVLKPDDAEFAARFTWPLLWIAPAAGATLVACRRLGLGVLNNAAVVIGAIILVSDINLYVQFRPGRIDHHDVQMTCVFLAFAGATLRGRPAAGAVLAGLATALGSAIGLEGLVFAAAIGGFIALRFGFYRAGARAAGAYGLSLGLAAAVLFLVQTPPTRWGTEACDALAPNLVAAFGVAGLGLAALARWGAGWRPMGRLAALVGVGAVAGAAYLLLYPRCIHGFFADVDPRIRPIWLNYVQEVRPIGVILKRNLAQGSGEITIWSLGLLCWLLTGLRRERRRDFAWLLQGVLLLMATAAGASAIRMGGYAEWLAVPAIAAAAAELVAWAGYRNWLAVVLAGAVATPVTAQGLAIRFTPQVAHLFAKPGKGKARLAKPARAPVDRCFDDDSFDALADASPPGVVLADVDLGAFVVVNTDDSALAAPYHRMAWGILRAHGILKAPADEESATLARQAGIAYVLDCPLHAHHGDRADMKPDSLQKRLDADKPPNWLQPLSQSSDPLQAYRVLPPGRVAGPRPPPPKDADAP